MSAVLIKHGSPAAREASFPVGAPKQVREAEPAPPSELEIIVAELRCENESLRSEVARQNELWKVELESAEQRAKEAAARDYVRDDARRLETLVAALGEARQQFRADLSKVAERTVPELALLIVAKFVLARADERDWLARVVARRLEALDEGAVIALHLSAQDAEGGNDAAFASLIAPGTQIEVDPTLRPGTARLQLRIGELVVDPAEGLQRLGAALRECLDDA